MTALDPVRDKTFGMILAGGAGTRLWPLSTADRPKQFLPLASDRSLLRQAYERLALFLPDERIFVLTSAAFVSAVRDALPHLGPDQVLAEPVRRDTGPALLLAALHIAHRDPDAVMAIVTADHLIGDGEAFASDVKAACELAQEHGAMVTFGIPPQYAATTFGYLHCGDAHTVAHGATAMPVMKFVEKPDAARAKAFVDGGDHYWNSGMFVWRAETFLKQAREHMASQVKTLERVYTEGAALDDAFAAVTPISVDHGIMEHAVNVMAVRARFSWADIGGYAALAEHLPTDDEGNAFQGQLVTQDARGNWVVADAPDERIALLGVDDLIVVRSGTRTLVMPRQRLDELKSFIANLPDDWR